MIKDNKNSAGLSSPSAMITTEMVRYKISMGGVAYDYITSLVVITALIISLNNSKGGKVMYDSEICRGEDSLLTYNRTCSGGSGSFWLGLRLLGRGLLLLLLSCKCHISWLMYSLRQNT